MCDCILKIDFFCTRMHIQSYFCCLCHTQPNFRVFRKRMRIVLKYTRRAFGYDRRPLKYKRVAPPIFCNVFDIIEWHACHIEMLNWVYKPLRIIFSIVTEHIFRYIPISIFNNKLKSLKKFLRLFCLSSKII